MVSTASVGGGGVGGEWGRDGDNVGGSDDDSGASGGVESSSGIGGGRDDGGVLTAAARVKASVAVSVPTKLSVVASTAARAVTALALAVAGGSSGVGDTQRWQCRRGQGRQCWRLRRWRRWLWRR